MIKVIHGGEETSLPHRIPNYLCLDFALITPHS